MPCCYLRSLVSSSANGRYKSEYNCQQESAADLGRIRRFGPGAPLPQLWDGVRPMYRARAAAALPEARRHVPYIVLRLATLAPGSLRENNEQ